MQLNLSDITGTLAWKCSYANLSRVLDQLTSWFSKGVLKQEFRGIQVAPFFEMNNFGHIEAMKVIFSSKCSSVYVDFENTRKLPENADSFGDNCVWTCCRSFSQLWQGYMWRVVNVLKNGPKTSNLTRRHNTQLNLSDINRTLAWKCSCADMRSISH